ncbi:MAG: DUF4416 family protein [Thermodesulfobacteriota bacterium]
MSIPAQPDPARLVIGILTGRKDLLEPVAGDLTDRFGPVGLVSRWFDFDFTTYYNAEFGSPLSRRMFGFQNLIGQDQLAGIKQITNEIEKTYTRDGKRAVNIDPGYLLRERFVLATGKNFAHRIYIGNGIYADLTLLYYDKAFQSLPWTYPDYADGAMQSFLTQVRNRYVIDLKNEGSRAQGAGKPEDCL